MCWISYHQFSSFQQQPGIESCNIEGLKLSASPSFSSGNIGDIQILFEQELGGDFTKTSLIWEKQTLY